MEHAAQTRGIQDMMPDGWSKVPVGQLSKFSGGHGFGPRDWSRSGYPIIRIQNLNGSNDYNYFSGKPDPEWIVEAGELLFAWAGVKGVSFGPTIWNGPTGVLNQHIHRVKPLDGVDKVWFHAALLLATAAIERNAHGFKSSLVHVRQSEILRARLPVPPLPEQRAIAAVLSTWDSAIEQTSRLIQAKKKLKQALMQQLLTGKRRSADHDGEWSRSYIGDLLKEEDRLVDWDDTSLYRLASVRRWNGGLFYRENLYGSQIKVKKLKTIRTGDFVISHIQGAYGAMALVPTDFDGAKVSDLYSVLVPRDEGSCDIRFFNYLSQTPRMRSKIYAACNGFFAERLRLNFSPRDFLRQTVRVPACLEEQRRIADVLDAMTSEISLLERRLEAIRRQKKGLMQKLLTGQIRVKV